MRRERRPECPSDSGAPAHRRWVSVIPVASERRFYFVATLILIGWYLLDRLLSR